MGRTVLVVVAFLLTSAIALAAPSIQINSPQNTTYSAYGAIQINVTSNETADFFVKSKFGKNTVVARGATSYSHKFFGARGLHKYTIFANNSGGTSNTSVSFSINHSSVINVTDCGDLGTPDTTYVLQNNITTGSVVCITFFQQEIILDLNGYTISAERPINADCIHSEIKNGMVSSTVGGPGITLDSGSKCQIRNITSTGGFALSFLSNSLLEDIRLNSGGIGIDFVDSSNVVIKNATINTSQPNSIGIQVQAFDSSMIIENSSVNNFTHDFSFSVNNLDLYMRNNAINLTSVSPDTEITSAVRVFKQHLLRINVTDAAGLGKAASIEVIDNGVLVRTNAEESIYTFLSNPTGRILEGTDANGTVLAYITERLIVYTTSSPLETTEYVFGPYNITARSGNQVDQAVSVNTNVNSVINLTFSIPTNTTSLPTCTIDQMLDLDNNGEINSKDAKVILRWMTGHNVTVNNTKQCNGINFFPV